MGPNDYYDLCCRYHGKKVRITDKQGRVHVGQITRVNRQMVWIQPDSNYGGYGFGYYGFGGFGGLGFGYGIALGAIAGIALAGAFFW